MGNFLPKDYVGVNVRIDQFHEKYPEGSIKTEFKLDGNVAVFSAEVSDGKGKVFNGHSFGQLGREKAFEKLETVAVGRALAFMGFETKAGIASREEIEEFEEKQSKPIFADKNLEALKLAVSDGKFTTAEYAIQKAKENYTVTKTNEIQIRNLF